ncbi:MAG: sugar phosphate isomerase/epimerase [Planctomycetaceae bacterium]|nr:sugar phosphate isomerase/epimerase [Planctomycetaceae bacterium]
MMNRRQFLATGGAALLGLAGRTARALPFQAAPFKVKIKKAIIGNPDEASFKRAKDHGFDGVQLHSWNHKPDDARRARELAEKIGVQIPSLIRAWVPLDSPKADEVDKIVGTIETALLAAEGFGCTNILLVPALSPKVAIPPAHEFDIDMDDAGIVSRVVKGDNTKYQPYIDAQNRATKSSWEVMKRLTPIAEKTKVVIALENVWNNLWVRPALFKKFIDGHQHPMVRAFFDCANNVKYGIPPETWIRTLGKSVMELHIKEYRLNPDGQSGVWTNLRENGINWPEVRKALDEVGFDGYATIEESGAKPNVPIEEQAKRLDLILDGK